MTSARDLLGLVKFSHSIFALPFALVSAWVAAAGVPALDRLAWIVVCAVTARTAVAESTSRYRAVSSGPR